MAFLGKLIEILHTDNMDSTSKEQGYICPEETTPTFQDGCGKNLVDQRDLETEETIWPEDSGEPELFQQPAPEESRTTEDVEIEKNPFENYVFPPLMLLEKELSENPPSEQLNESAQKLQDTLRAFGIDASVINVSKGPLFTRYEIQIGIGVRISKIKGLIDDIKMSLSAKSIHIEAPIPGRATIGIDVENECASKVLLGEILETETFHSSDSSLTVALGRDIAGDDIIVDIDQIFHLLIAGATGSGKSVCINSIIMSILYKSHPCDVKFILIDTKNINLAIYEGIPHLLLPIITDHKRTSTALEWAVLEMQERYERFSSFGVKDLKGYNRIAESGGRPLPKIPQILIIIDDLSDLMAVGSEIEEHICRLARRGRACGIYLIVSTQLLTTSVITGPIKANMPGRIAFSVFSSTDSKVILDQKGAEGLSGNGDMLFYSRGLTNPIRVQGSFVSDQEIKAVVEFLKIQCPYDSEASAMANADLPSYLGTRNNETNNRDFYFVDAGKLVIERGKGSIGTIQRWFKIGFNRAARIMDQLEEAGVVGPEEGTKPRRILMSMEEFEEYIAY